MASIFTELAFMHGHIVDRELILRLGRDDEADRGAGSTVRQAPATKAPARRKARAPQPLAAARPGCAVC